MTAAVSVLESSWPWWGEPRDAGQVSPDEILWDTSPRGVRIDMTRGVAVGTGPGTFVPPGFLKVVGSRFAERIKGTAHRDVIDGGPGSDRISGLGGDDDIYDGDPCCSNTPPGNDTLWGGAGNDYLSPSSGRGRRGLRRRNRGTIFDALAGDDTFEGSGFADVFNGGAGTDRSLEMQNGSGTCISVEILDVPNCETVIP